jgi:hypothetical protein
MLTTVHCRQSSKAKTLEIRSAAALDTIRSSHIASVICLSSCATRRTDTSTLLRARYPQIAQAEKMTILYLASSDSFPNVKPTILQALLSLNPNWQSNRKRAMRLHSQQSSNPILASFTEFCVLEISHHKFGSSRYPSSCGRTTARASLRCRL